MAMDTKLIRVDEKTWLIIRAEAIRLSGQKGMVISMTKVLRQFANKLNKRHGLLKG